MTAPESRAASQRKHRRRGLIAVVADASGATRGQISTAIVSVLLAGTLALGLPPVLRNRQADVDETRAAPLAATNRPVESPTVPSTPDDAAPVLNPFVGSRTDEPVRVGDAPAATRPAASTSASPSGPVAPPVGSARVFAPVGPPGAPDGIAVGPDGGVYVATNNGAARGRTGASQVLKFGPDGTAAGAWTVTGQPEGHRLGLTGLALDRQGGLLTLDASTGRVLRFALSSGRQTTYAELFDLPSCQLVVLAVNGCEPGVADDPPLPRALALDGKGVVYVTDAAQGTIWRVPAGGGKPAPFFGDAAFASPDGLDGIALLPDGTIVVASPEATEATKPASGGGGAIYRLSVVDGAPGAKSLFASFDAGQGPAGLALLDNESMVVTLRYADAVVLLNPTGAEERRVTGRAGDVVIDGPAGVAFHGRTVLVVNRSPTSEVGWAVLAVGVR